MKGRISNPNNIPPYNRLASTGQCITCSSTTTTKERPHEILEHITLSTTSSLRDEEDILGDLFQYLLSAHEPTSTAKTIWTDLQDLFLSKNTLSPTDPPIPPYQSFPFPSDPTIRSSSLDTTDSWRWRSLTSEDGHL
jgi:hypothetical protein